MNKIAATIVITALLGSAAQARIQTADDESRRQGQPVEDGSQSGLHKALGQKNPDAIVFDKEKKKQTHKKSSSSQGDSSQALFTGVDNDTLTYYQIGRASWYGKRFHGKKTASGQKFDMYKHTAAHRTLPFGTRVLVRNLENGKEVSVTINDRGPYSNNRIIDLSYAAAASLDFTDQGSAKVGLILVDAQPKSHAHDDSSQKKDNRQVRLNLSDPDNLRQNQPQRQKSKKLSQNQKDPFLIWENQGKGPDKGSTSARSLKQKKGQEGFNFQKQEDNQRQNRSGDDLKPQGGTVSVQVGSFKVKDNALRLKSKMELKYQQPVYIHKTSNWYKVWVGEFQSRAKAQSFQKQLKQEGFNSILHSN
jgi:rare lipoprotein A